ncbi:MAG: (Fe-S)-binding protein, partial [Chloroflexota bacterium]
GAGRTLISKGFLDAARRQAHAVLAAVQRADPTGALPLVGVEPSEVQALIDEYLDLLPGDAAAQALSRRAWTVEEFLVRPGPDGSPRLQHLPAHAGPQRTVLLHGHCYQKARPPADDGLPVGVQASRALLEACGCRVQVLDTGCCGMAGAFGYESEHIDVSLKVGELALFPAVRAAPPEALVAAAGVSCREQIHDGTQRRAWHPIELVYNNPTG